MKNVSFPHDLYSLVDIVLAVETNEYIFSKVSNVLIIDAKL